MQRLILIGELPLYQVVINSPTIVIFESLVGENDCRYESP